jgi:hypothetical protein
MYNYKYLTGFKSHDNGFGKTSELDPYRLRMGKSITVMAEAKEHPGKEGTIIGVSAAGPDHIKVKFTDGTKADIHIDTIVL